MFFQAAAGGFRAGWIQSGCVLEDVRDLSVHVNHERYSVRDAGLLHEHAVCLRNFAHVIAQKRILRVQFLGPVAKRCNEIGADCQNLRFVRGEFADTRLVGGEFLRSTTGERGREECQHDVLLAAIIR